MLRLKVILCVLVVLAAGAVLGPRTHSVQVRAHANSVAIGGSAKDSCLSTGGQGEVLIGVGKGSNVSAGENSVAIGGDLTNSSITIGEKANTCP